MPLIPVLGTTGRHLCEFKDSQGHKEGLPPVSRNKNQTKIIKKKLIEPQN